MASSDIVREPLLQRVSWGALLAGFFVGFPVWLMLLALGAGIGLGTFDPRQADHWQGLGIGFGIWGVLSGILSFFVAGWVAGRLSAAEDRTAGMLHGAAVWGVIMVFGLWLGLSAVSGAVNTAGRVVGQAAQTAGESGAASGGDAQDLRQEAEAQARQAQQQAQQALQSGQAGQAADQAATASSVGTLGYFVYGLLGLLAAALGGGAGTAGTRRTMARHVPVMPSGAAPQRA